MKTSIHFSLFLSIFLLFSCAQESKEASKEASSSQKSRVEKTVMNKSEENKKNGIADYAGNVLGGLKVGDRAPDFALQDEKGNKVSLDESLKEGPVLLVFYRADWCPYCTKHLAEFQDKINGMKDSPANVIAISPQMPKYSKKLSEENKYTFPILYDEDHVAMKDYKVFFRVTPEYNEKILSFKGDYIQTRNGDTDPYMPVPATYLIGQDKRIKYVHYDENYRVRADVDEALASISK